MKIIIVDSFSTSPNYTNTIGHYLSELARNLFDRSSQRYGMFEDEKKYIIAALENNSPAVAAIAKKNWRRYSKTVELMLPHSDADTTNLILDYGAGHGIVAKLLILLGYRVCRLSRTRATVNYGLPSCSGLMKYTGLLLIQTSCLTVSC